MNHAYYTDGAAYCQAAENDFAVPSLFDLLEEDPTEEDADLPAPSDLSEMPDFSNSFSLEKALMTATVRDKVMEGAQGSDRFHTPARACAAPAIPETRLARLRAKLRRRNPRSGHPYRWVRGDRRHRQRPWLRLHHR